MKRGRTIVAEREYAESDSERLEARRREKRKNRLSVFAALLLLVILGALAHSSIRSLISGATRLPEPVVESYDINAELVDETGRGTLSVRMKQYIGRLEQDFRDLGYRVTKITLPVGTSRELYIDLAGETPYFKISTDRDAAVSAEDAVRMLKYLREHNLTPVYVDVRTEGKAYYK